jgi:hypothetical protein
MTGGTVILVADAVIALNSPGPLVPSWRALSSLVILP